MNFDLHVHSRESYDSVASLASIIDHASRRGLRGIALTDHEVLASEEAAEISASKGVWLIRGIEAKTEIGDIIGLFLSKDLKSRRAERLLDEIHEQDGIAILAHPFKYLKNADRYPAKLLERIDAIEQINSRWKDLEQFKQNAEVGRVLCAVTGRSAGSDAHFPFEIGRAYWQTRPLASPQELKHSIRTNDGRAVAESFSHSLDGASQCVKFAKNPTLKQLARMAFWSSRRLIAGQRSFLE